MPPAVIYIIRHGEKPTHPAGGHGKTPAEPRGVDYLGTENAHSLVPRGWQRSGALVTLFDTAGGETAGGETARGETARGETQASLRTPGALLTPAHGHPGDEATHRTYQTVAGLSDRLGVAITSAFPEGQEAQLAASVVSGYSGVVLICWDHNHIPALASSLPAVPGTAIPQAWPADRFDVTWVFTLATGPAVTQYVFRQVPQQLLSGDASTVIEA